MGVDFAFWAESTPFFICVGVEGLLFLKKY